MPSLTIGRVRRPVERVLGLGRQVLRWVRRRLRPGACVADHAAVLDGRTLTIEGTVQRRAVGDAASPALVLTDTVTNVEHRCAMLVRSRDATTISFSAAVLLGNADGAVPLSVGTWRVAVAGDGDDDAPVPVTMARRMVDAGPTLLNPRDPELGVRYVPGSTTAAHLQITMKLPPAHAEVRRLWPRADRLSVEGSFIGPIEGDTRDAEVVLTDSASGATRTVPVQVDGDPGQFRFEVPARMLVTTGRGAQRLDTSMVLRNGTVLTVGRLLDDARSPQDVYDFPGIVVEPSSAEATHVRPSFNRKRRLIITRRPVSRSLGDAA